MNVRVCVIVLCIMLEVITAQNLAAQIDVCLMATVYTNKNNINRCKIRVLFDCGCFGCNNDDDFAT